jgi:hypothetical protein
MGLSQSKWLCPKEKVYEHMNMRLPNPPTVKEESLKNGEDKVSFGNNLDMTVTSPRLIKTFDMKYSAL